MKCFLVLCVFCFFTACTGSKMERHKKKAIHEKQVLSDFTPICSDQKCYGTYKGVEFDDSEQGDIAHQYSNTMSKYVGDQLKKMYSEGKYSKVDFDHIRMTTKGMNDGDNYVIYTLEIPFLRVDKEEAMTAFDHSGGWNHYPAIEKRKKKLLESERSTVKDGKLYVSNLKTTKEGLQEFWIQWKHKDF